MILDRFSKYINDRRVINLCDNNANLGSLIKGTQMAQI